MPPKITSISHITYRLIPAKKLAQRIAEHHQLTFADLLCYGAGRKPDSIIKVRQIALLAIYDGLDVSTGHLSLLFTYKQSTGAALALRVAKDRLRYDRQFARLYHHTLASLAIKAA